MKLNQSTDLCATEVTTDALKTTSEKAIQEKAEESGDAIGNNFVDKS